MKKILVGTPLLGEAMIGERPVHGLDDVVSLAELLQGRLSFVGHKPASGLRLGGETITLQPLRPADQKMPVLADRIGAALARPQIDDALGPLLGEQHLIEPGQALGVDVACEFPGDFDLALMSEFPGDEFVRPLADAMRDVVARDVQNLSVVGASRRGVAGSASPPAPSR